MEEEDCICVWRVLCKDESHASFVNPMQSEELDTPVQSGLGATDGTVFEIQEKRSCFEKFIVISLSPIYYTFPCASLLSFSILATLKVDGFINYSWKTLFLPIYLSMIYLALMGAIELIGIFSYAYVLDYMQKEILYFCDIGFLRKSCNWFCFAFFSIFCILLPGFLDDSNTDNVNAVDLSSMSVVAYMFMAVFSLRILLDFYLLILPGLRNFSPQSSNIELLVFILKSVYQICFVCGLFIWWIRFETIGVTFNPSSVFEVSIVGVTFLVFFSLPAIFFAIRKIGFATNPSITNTIDSNYIIDLLQVVIELSVFFLLTLIVFVSLLSLNKFSPRIRGKFKFSEVCSLPWVYSFLTIIVGSIGNFRNVLQSLKKFNNYKISPAVNDIDLKVLTTLN